MSDYKFKIGESFPDFSMISDEGKNVDLASIQGTPVVIYFYPKDNTPGCTTESKEFSELYDEFKKINCRIFGVSKDTMKKHQNFKSKFNFPFNLLVDENAEFCQKLGIYKEKSMFGKKYMGIERTTFLLDEKGKIVEIWPKVSVTNHAKEVLGRAKFLFEASN